MERANAHQERQLVRCLECGTVYSLAADRLEAAACPECGNVGWVALSALRRAENGTSS